MSKILPILFIGLILSACAGMPASTQVPELLETPTDSTSTACSSPSTWTIEYNRSGGFAGFNESLTLDNGGRLKVQSERPPTDVEKMLSDDQVKAITDLLVQTCPFEVPADKGVCADCFLYELKIQMDAHKYSAQATDVTLTEDLNPLVSALSQLLQDTAQ
jgi:hypothetical protein